MTKTDHIHNMLFNHAAFSKTALLCLVSELCSLSFCYLPLKCLQKRFMHALTGIKSV